MPRQEDQKETPTLMTVRIQESPGTGSKRLLTAFLPLR